MGIRERRDREKADLRRAILDAARDLFVAEGYEAVTMRKIAAAIEYSATTIYLHFADKEAILNELTNEGFLLLAGRLATVAGEPDPIERLRRGGHIYFAFAREYQAYYTIMFEMSASPMAKHKDGPDSAYAMECGYRAFSFILQAVSDAIQQDRIAPAVLDEVRAAPEMLLSHTVWSAMHGVVSLLLSDRLGMLPEAAHPYLLHAVVENLLRGLTCDDRRAP